EACLAAHVAGVQVERDDDLGHLPAFVLARPRPGGRAAPAGRGLADGRRMAQPHPAVGAEAVPGAARGGAVRAAHACPLPCIRAPMLRRAGGAGCAAGHTAETRLAERLAARAVVAVELAARVDGQPHGELGAGRLEVVPAVLGAEHEVAGAGADRLGLVL